MCVFGLLLFISGDIELNLILTLHELVLNLCQDWSPWVSTGSHRLLYTADSEDAGNMWWVGMREVGLGGFGGGWKVQLLIMIMSKVFMFRVRGSSPHHHRASAAVTVAIQHVEHLQLGVV